MKETIAKPPTVLYGFGCTCTSEKVIFCYNKKTGQKTWSCAGKCFEATEITYSPPLNNSHHNTSHNSSATQTQDEPDQPTAAKPIETDADSTMDADNIPPSSSMQYILSGNVVYCVSQAIHVDLEPVPVLDKPEGIHYNDEDDESGSEMAVEQENDKDGSDDDDIVDKEQGVDKSEFMCIVCGKVFKRKGFLTRHLKNHQKELEGKEMEIQQRQGNEKDDDDDDGNDVNDDKAGDDDDGDDDNDDDDDDDSDDDDDGDGDYVAEDEVDDSDDEESENDDTFQSNKKPSSLKTKRKEGNKKDTLQCDFCEKTFIIRAYFEKHVQAHERRELLQCEVCVTTFKSDKSLKTHNKKHFEEELNCFFCPQVIRSRYELEKHILIHPKKKSFKCDTCQKEIKSVYLFAKHLAKHKDRKCEDCEKMFKTEKQLQKHQKAHGKDNSLEASATPEEAHKQCPHCDKVCTASEYRSHVSKAHRKRKVPQGPLECTYCGKLNDGRSAHVRHLRVHTKEKPFKCSFENCEKAFSGKGDLLIHVRRHTGERPFKCERCDKGFVKKWNLTEHLRTHTGAKPYKCDFCEKSFGFKNVLKVHLALHTGEKRFKCPHCENRYVKEVLLKMHLVSHSGEKPYKCLQCDKAFVYKSGLNEHLRMHKM